jgi:gluconolactonase
MASEFSTLIDEAAPVTCLGRDYQVTEGPVWVPSQGCLYFHDIPGDTRWRWTAEEGMQVAATPTFKANGMCLDANGDLLVCEQVTSCLVRFPIDGGPRELVAFHYGGKYLNSPNDVVVRGADGAIYFTDPDFGRWNDWIGQKRSRDGVGYRGVYRVPGAGGDVELLVSEDEFNQPNGLCFSPDQTRLYVNDSRRAQVKVFDVRADGTLSDSRLLIDDVGGGSASEGSIDADARVRPPAPDGMECDEIGNVWVTGPGGIWVVSPDGEHLGTVSLPESAKSLVWGGEHMHSLFAMTTTTVHVVETLVGPAPLPPD